MTKYIAVHDDFMKLIDRVREIYLEDLGFKPTIINTTLAITKKVEENKLYQ